MHSRLVCLQNESACNYRGSEQIVSGINFYKISKDSSTTVPTALWAYSENRNLGVHRNKSIHSNWCCTAMKRCRRIKSVVAKIVSGSIISFLRPAAASHCSRTRYRFHHHHHATVSASRRAQAQTHCANLEEQEAGLHLKHVERKALKRVESRNRRSSWILRTSIGPLRWSYYVCVPRLYARHTRAIGNAKKTSSHRSSSGRARRVTVMRANVKKHLALHRAASTLDPSL